MAKQTPETALKRAVTKLLRIYGIITWPYPAGVMGVRGFPDRFGILKSGRFLAIEFKSNNRQLTDHQEQVKKQIEQAGGRYIVCRCLEDIIKGLELPGQLF